MDTRITIRTGRRRPMAIPRRPCAESPGTSPWPALTARPGKAARRGTNIWPDTGGGWINGRGDDTMVMLKGYEHMVDFFTSFEWWKTEPHDELVNNGAYCLAKPGEIYAVYLPVRPMCGNSEAFEHQKVCGDVTIKLEPGTYEARWFNAYTGETVPLSPVEGRVWTLPKTPGWLDWALLLQKRK